MPRIVRKHGTQDGQQTNVELYKVVSKYTKMKSVKDDLSKKIKDIYEDNIWDLQDKFSDLQKHYKDLSNSGKIAWVNGIQYLEFIKKPAKPQKIISLKQFKEGKYKSLHTYKKPNTVTTEMSYASRIDFFTKEFQPFHKYKNVDNISWIVDNERQLMYNILYYHNNKANSISSVNKDFKVMIRSIKLVLGEHNELRYKWSALQIALTDLSNLEDDINKVGSDQELNTFVPYEQLLDICDKLDADYKSSVMGLPKDGRLHSNAVFQKHQVLLAMVINVWNYPSRSENYSLRMIMNESQALKNENYLLLTNEYCELIYNQMLKDHKPIRYKINSPVIAGLNKRLCYFLKYSFTTYPRPYLFINSTLWSNKRTEKVSHTTVSNWIRNLTEKNIGIDTFRMAFVSYYFPKFNNQNKNILRVRMRTSTDIILRSYLKVYQNPDDLVRVKIEPDSILVRKTSNGQTKTTAIEIDYSKVFVPMQRVDHYDPKLVPIVNVKPMSKTNIMDMKKKTFRKWYNIDKNAMKLREKQRKPFTYAKRYVRELNNGKLKLARLLLSTIQKYKIKLSGNGKYSTMVI